ncbi:MAG: DUF2064 domain-containing protein [Flavobacteriales bacterium]|nr:DUF2064 domain-containing protein [Flavobacteriales bacterium]
MNKTAILFFSQTSAKEAVTKNLYGRERSAKLADVLISRTKEHIERSNLPVFHFHEGNQRGCTFGARLSHAFQSLFNLGFQSIIAVGNDCPELENISWEKVLIHLHQGQAVLGQSLRGGAYLIGLNRAQFNFEDFSSLPWQKNDLFKSLCIAIAEKSDRGIHFLQVFRDVNSSSDLTKVLRTTNLSKCFKRLVIDIIGIIGINSAENFRFPAFFLRETKSLRAPPVAD